MKERAERWARRRTSRRKWSRNERTWSKGKGLPLGYGQSRRAPTEAAWRRSLNWITWDCLPQDRLFTY